MSMPSASVMALDVALAVGDVALIAEAAQAAADGRGLWAAHTNWRAVPAQWAQAVARGDIATATDLTLDPWMSRTSRAGALVPSLRALGHWLGGDEDKARSTLAPICRAPLDDDPFAALYTAVAGGVVFAGQDGQGGPDGQGDRGERDKVGGWPVAWESASSRAGLAVYASGLARAWVQAAERSPDSVTADQLRAVAAVLNDAEVAERLFISVRTVTSHLDHIYIKLGIGGRRGVGRPPPRLRAPK